MSNCRLSKWSNLVNIYKTIINHLYFVSYSLVQQGVKNTCYKVISYNVIKWVVSIQK